MANELILGVGQRASLVEVIHLAEEELHKKHGAARRVHLHAPNIDVQASRHDFEGEFDAYVVRLRLPGKMIEAIKQLPPPASVIEEDGVVEIRVHAPASGTTAGQPPAVLREVSAKIRLPEVWRVTGSNYRHDHLSTQKLFEAMIKFHASDVHLYPGSPPVFRVDNDIRKSSQFPPLSAEQILGLVQEIAPAKDWKEYQELMQCSFGYHQVGLGYSRVSAFHKAGVPHCTMRFLPEKIPSFEDLNMPGTVLDRLGRLRFGLILVVGMTGSGKSTTVASFVDWINEHKQLHILSIEEPVEYVHQDKRSMISQRDVKVDVHTFHEAVRGALRHDPDVIVIGEMRDPDTIRSAINAAATGHLVVSTLHSNTAAEVVNRIVSFFDPVERDLVKLQLRDALKCVICQRLVPRIGGGRVPAVEVLFNDTKHLNDGILAGDTEGIRVGMQQTGSESFIFEEYLMRLVQNEKITAVHGHEYASSPATFDQMKLGTYVIPSVESIKHKYHE